MRRRLVAAAVAASMSVVLSVPALAGTYTQLARAAGIAEAGAMSLDQIAALKFTGEGHDNGQTFVARPFDDDVMVRSSRTVPELSRDAYHLRLINASVSGDERQIEVRREVVRADPRARSQLAAGMRISAADAAGMTLGALAGRKFQRDPRE